MKFRITVLAVFMLNMLVLSANSGEIKYKVSEIPAGLLSDAKAVVRKNETEVEISDINKIIRRVTYAITILNENGIRNSFLIQYYDKFMSIRKIKINIYNSEGIEIKNGANVNVEDYSSNAGYSLYEDSRIKFLDPKYRTFPFTVEYTYEITYSSLFYYPDWSVYDDYNVSVQNTSLKIITPQSFKFRYLEKNMTNNCKVSGGATKKIYSWKYENMPAVKKEPFGKHFLEYTPVVYPAPSDFELGGYYGNLDSWNNFGIWLNKLGEGRNILDNETKDKIKLMVSGFNDENDKVKALYDYLQNKVRYVNIRIGIGGWQTIDARTVDHVSYGDCKALTNYMKSLLEVAGIRSYYTLVRSGEGAPAINADFPSNQFNHVILCVPGSRDTLWLECTSQNIPFGYLGTFTDDRKALLTNEEGATLVTTRKYNLADNAQIRTAAVDLSQDGNATATIRTVYKGILYDKIYPVLHSDETDSRQFIQDHISIPSYNLTGFSYVEKNSIIPAITEDLSLTLPNYGTKMGTRILIKPNLIARADKLPYKMKERKSEIIIRRAYSETDTIIYRLPVNYILEKIPPKISLVSKFGEYSSELIYDKKLIVYIRIFKLYNGIYPVEDYPEFTDFFEKVNSADESKLALDKYVYK